MSDARSFNASHDRTILHEGRFVRFVKRGAWEYVERTQELGLVCIVAVTDDDQLVLVEQHRPPIAAPVIELPAGLVGDTPGSDPSDLLLGAKRELEEETGYRAREWEQVAFGPPSAGLTTEMLAVFLATGLEKVGDGGGDDEEDIIVHTVPLATLDAWCREAEERGAWIDLKIFAGLWFLDRKRRG